MQKWDDKIFQLIKMDNGEIVIPCDGSFFLYSRLELYGRAGGNNSHSVTQTIRVKRALSPMYRPWQVTRHKCPSNDNSHSLSMEGIFRLETGDKIQMVFKVPEGVTPTDQHLGIFKI